MQLQTRAKSKPTQWRKTFLDVATDEPPESFVIFQWGSNPSDKGDAILTKRGVENIYRVLGTRDVMMDLEHLSLDRDCVNYDPDSRAWLQLTDDERGLVAVGARWTADGERRLREKLQRFISPAFYTNDVSKTFDDGPPNEITELVNIALTALPATTYIAPLVAANIGGTAVDYEQLLAALRMKLGLPEDAPIEQILIATLDAMGPVETGDSSPDEPPDPDASAVADGDEPEEPEALTADDESMTEETRAIMQLAKSANARAAKAEKAIADMRTDKEREGIIALNRKKLPGKLLPWARKLSVAALKAYLKDAPDFESEQIREPASEPVTLSQDHERLCKKLGTDPERVKKILARNQSRGPVA
jgi:hypothetical protein